jgi:hypothetical protein
MKFWSVASDIGHHRGLHVVPGSALDDARGSLVTAIALRWGMKHTDAAIADDVLALTRVLMRLSHSTSVSAYLQRQHLHSAYDLTSFALQLAPSWGSPVHTSALMLRGLCRVSCRIGG